MSCSSNCGSQRDLVEMMIENAIAKAVANGTLQAALSDCDGGKLGAGAKVLLCSALASEVKELIKDGTIDVVTDVKIEDGKLVVTDGAGKETKTELPAIKDIDVQNGKLIVVQADGTKEEVQLPGVKTVTISDDKLVVTNLDGSQTETALPTGTADLAFDGATNLLTWTEDGKDKQVTLPFVKAVAGDKEIVFTLPDGSTVSAPKAGSALSPDNLDHTIQKGANVPDKYGVKLKDKGGLSDKTTDGLEVLTGAGLTKDANGNVAVKTGTGLTTDGDGNLKIDGDGVAKNIADGLAGSGLTASNGQLSVATVRLMDASGTVHLGNLVDVTK